MANNLLDIATKNDDVPGTSNLRELYPSPYGQPRVKSPGANAWFDQGGKVFGKQLPGWLQHIVAGLGTVGLTGGPKVNVSGKASSLLDDIIARNKQGIKNIAKGPTPKELDEARRMLPEDILERADFIESTGKPLSKKEAIDFFSKLSNKSRWQQYKKKFDEPFKYEYEMSPADIASYYKDKMHLVPDEMIDDVQIWNTLRNVDKGIHGIPKGQVLQDLGLEKATMTKNEILQYINRQPQIAPGTGGMFGVRSKLTNPMGGKEEVARKAGLLTRKDIDYEQIPAFIRRKIDNDLLR